MQNVSEIVLASGSPRRRELLEMLGLRFRIQCSGAEESVPEGTGPEAMVAQLARRKLEAVLPEIDPGALCIAADTVVACGENGAEILGKPRDREDAARMLRLLSGRTHAVHTGLAVHRGGRTLVRSVATRVTFRPLRDAEIAHYIRTADVCGKAGAYGIQEYAGCFAEKIEGDVFSVIGLPICPLSEMLEELGCPLETLVEDHG